MLQLFDRNPALLYQMDFSHRFFQLVSGLVFTGIELWFVLRHPDCNRTFFVKYALKSQALQAASLLKWQSACFCLSYNEKRSVIEFSRNNSSLTENTEKCLIHRCLLVLTSSLVRDPNCIVKLKSLYPPVQSLCYHSSSSVYAFTILC